VGLAQRRQRRALELQRQVAIFREDSHLRVDAHAGRTGRSRCAQHVADAVGYTSVEALAHAFDACGLPSATEVRRSPLAATFS